MEWARRQRADVVSMSLGGDVPSDGTDPMALAVDRLSEHTGRALRHRRRQRTAGSAASARPGAAQSALTVGAVDGADERAYYSRTWARASATPW